MSEVKTPARTALETFRQIPGGEALSEPSFLAGFSWGEASERKGVEELLEMANSAFELNQVLLELFTKMMDKAPSGVKVSGPAIMIAALNAMLPIVQEKIREKLKALKEAPDASQTL